MGRRAILNVKFSFNHMSMGNSQTKQSKKFIWMSATQIRQYINAIIVNYD